MDDRILLRDIRFHGRHGVDRRERKIGQWYTVDLDLYLDLRQAGLADDLTLTVDYGEICMAVMQLGTRKRFRLIEALAEQISERILNSFPVKRVRVSVTKSPPADFVAALSGQGTLGSAVVEIIRDADVASEAQA